MTKQIRLCLTLILFPLLFIDLFLDRAVLATSRSSLPEKKLLVLHTRFQSKHQYHHHNNNATSTYCFSHNSRDHEDSTTLEIKQRDHCFRKTSKDLWQRRQVDRLILDNDQVRFLQSRMKNSFQTLSNAQIPVTSGSRLQIMNYVVTMRLGGKNMTVIVDTGSDLTWIQCEPCRSCYTQHEPLFNPSSSLSYRLIPCNSSSCRFFQDATGNFGPCPSNSNNNSTCNYIVNYGDGSYTRGDLGRDVLNLGKTFVKKSFVFGCGRSNKGLFGGTSGVMGLGNSSLSIITQTSNQFGGVFSYCLPSSDQGGSGSLTLGENSSIYRNTTEISYTKMVHSPGLSTFYMLNMTGMSVGGVGLNATSSFGQNGVLIDSGTVISRLPPSVYSALKAEFLKQFSGFARVPGFSILDTCFDLSGYNEVNIPTVRMQFEGNAELGVDVNGVFYFVKDDASQTCLAFASLAYEDEIAIIGNYQQKNLRVVYDTNRSVVGFAEEKCSF